MGLFKKKEQYLFENTEGGAKLTRYAGSEAKLVIASEWEGKPVVEIAENAFYDAGKAEEITLPSTVKKIGTSAFRGCKSLLTVHIPASCTEIGDYAFGGCKNLETVVLPEIDSVSEGLFQKSGLKSIVIPDSVKSIGEDAFAGCSRLESVDIGKNVASIGENAFKNCSDKLSVVLPADIEVKNPEVLENVNMLYRRVNGGIALLRYGGHDTQIALPDMLGNEPIVGIGNGVFRMFAYLEKITLPSGLRVIGEQAFAGCSGLNEIIFPSTLEYIGRAAFSSCGPRVNRPGYMARKASDFDDEDGLKKIVIPASVKTVEEMAFAGCTALSDIVIESGKTAIGGGAFIGCPIEEITLPEGMTEIQTETFRNCMQLKKVNFPSTLESVWQHAFVNCEALEEINLPSKLQVIGDSAFAGCIAVKKLNIPASVREIQDGAFAYNSLEEISIDAGNRRFEMINGCLVDKKAGKLICAVIEEGANVTIPGSVNEIGAFAFAGSPVSEVTVPAFVKKIGQAAFQGSSITKITVENPNIELTNDALLDTDEVEIIADDKVAAKLGGAVEE